jgi:DNA polymerase
MMPEKTTPGLAPATVLRWYLDAGVDEAIGEHPVDRYALAVNKAAPKIRPATAVPLAAAGPALAGGTPDGSRLSAAHLAMECRTLDDLKAAMERYDGCALKRTCQRLVFADGNPDASVMLIGEAPGADEDRLGLPFVGVSGKLLDRMLASIGLDRNSAYITNVVPWRPPGNRKPEPGEVELCLPFIARHIELVAPAILVFLGGAPTTALLAKQDAISRLRGRWHDYSSSGLARPIPALPTYHPAYLLRTPLHKREAWADFLSIRKKLDSHVE